MSDRDDSVENMKIQTKKNDIGLFCIITVIIIWQLVKLGNYPGLYLDAINPDYIGVQLIYPQESASRWQVSWPWLCQIYHGNVGIIITMISTLITGSTSVLQYHITYGLVASVAVYLVYKVLTHKRVGISKIWAALGAIVIISWPSLFTTIITQFYMGLFGSICVLGGSILFLNWLDNVTDFKKISLCYLLFGLAFYSYFNFLFFLPSLILSTVWALKKENQLSFSAITVPLVAYLLGCGLFIVGWSQIALYYIGIDMNAFKKAALFILVYAMLALAYLVFYKNWKIKKIVLCAYLIGGAIWVINILPSMKAFVSLSVFDNATLGDKIHRVLEDFSSIVSGRYAEMMIYGKTVTDFNGHAILAAVVLALIALIMELIGGKRAFKWKAPLCIAVLYLFCCIGFGSHMQPQHYVPLIFLTFVSAFLSIQSIFLSLEKLRFCKNIARTLYKHKNMILGILGASLILLNQINVARVINEIKNTGGEGYWAIELNEMAEKANTNKSIGKKEFYVFSDWGFFAGFNYLTMNDIPFSSAIDENQLISIYAEGNDIVTCYWNGYDTEKYKQLYKSINDGTGTIIADKWVDSNGKTEFYVLSLSHTNEAQSDEDEKPNT